MNQVINIASWILVISAALAACAAFLYSTVKFIEYASENFRVVWAIMSCSYVFLKKRKTFIRLKEVLVEYYDKVDELDDLKDKYKKIQLDCSKWKNSAEMLQVKLDSLTPKTHL